MHDKEEEEEKKDTFDSSIFIDDLKRLHNLYLKSFYYYTFFLSAENKS